MSSTGTLREQRREIVVAYLKNQTDDQWRKLQTAVLNTTRILHVLSFARDYLREAIKWENLPPATAFAAQQTHDLIAQLITELAANDFRPLTLAEIERHAILKAIPDAHGNIIQAAENLGIGKTTMYRRLRKYGVPVRRYWLPKTSQQKFPAETDKHD